MKYYISDLHLGDERVFRLCDRKFTFIEFNKMIIYNWNSIVKENDEVYMIGDIAQDEYNDAIEVLKKLNGLKYMIVGNHDLKMLSSYLTYNIFQSVDYFKLIEDNGRKVFLCHYPVMDWMEFNRGGYHIYGHIHNKQLPEIKEYYRNKLAYNVSSDVIDFKPKTLNELIILKEQNKDAAYIN